MFTLSQKHNINYVAKIVRINNLRKHSNADRLRCTSIDGCNVIVGADQNEGDVGVYFPAECQISKEFLQANNLYKDKELNSDQTKIGFFDKNGRVRVLKLRGEKSEGFWIPVDSLNHSPYQIDFNACVAHEDKEFDSVADKILVRKYKIQYTNAKTDSAGKAAKPTSILIEEQFHFHIDTPQLGKNAWKFKPETFVSITQKLHGTSFISSKVLTKRPLTWLERAARFLGCKVVDSEYKNLYASRRVIKNLSANVGSYYSEDIWGLANNVVEPHLRDGMTVYGEVVGFLPNGSCIQKNYDYGCGKGKHQIYIYRITWTLPNGHVVEWSWSQIKEWCRFHDLLHVPELYRGTINQWNRMSSGSQDARSPKSKFLDVLKNTYLEKKANEIGVPCVRCRSDAWDEGIVVRIEDSSDFDVYKLKSFNFFQYETKRLDQGENDVESQQDEDVAAE